MRLTNSIISLAFFTISTVILAATDTDQDGIDDDVDLCSNTPSGSAVWSDGEYIGCAAGQYRDSEQPSGPAMEQPATNGDERQQLFDAIDACEQNLLEQLNSVPSYPGYACNSYVDRINASTQAYLDLSHAEKNLIVTEMLLENMRARLALCVNSSRALAGRLGELNASGCIGSYPSNGSPARTSTSGSSATRPAANTPPPAAGGYRRGVTYTTSGHVTHGSDGSTYTTSSSGRVTHGSNGVTYTTSGHVTHGSNGVTYVSSGRIIRGSDGSTCVRSGRVTRCH